MGCSVDDVVVGGVGKMVWIVVVVVVVVGY